MFTLQLTFQAVLATDGMVSFAVFIYADTDELVSIEDMSTIGFNAGDRTRLANFMPDSLGTVNVFRIDGMCIDTHGIVSLCQLRLAINLMISAFSAQLSQ